MVSDQTRGQSPVMHIQAAPRFAPHLVRKDVEEKHRTRLDKELDNRMPGAFMVSAMFAMFYLCVWSAAVAFVGVVMTLATIFFVAVSTIGISLACFLGVGAIYVHSCKDQAKRECDAELRDLGLKK